MNLGNLSASLSSFFKKKSIIPQSKIGVKYSFWIFFFFLRIMRKYLQSNMAHGMWPIKAFSFPSSYSEQISE